MTLYIVATPIGNLSDISQRALDTLASVSLVAAEDTRHSIKLLNHYGIRTPLISYHKFNEKERAAQLVQKMQREQIDIAIISDAGTPCISDPGYTIVRHALDNGIRVVPIPGCSAVAAALSVCGFDTQEFAFYGFLPRDNSKRSFLLKRIKQSDVLVFVLYESPYRVIDTLQDLQKHMELDAFILNDATKLYETATHGDIQWCIDKLSQQELKGEFAIVCKKRDFVSEKELPLAPEALLLNAMLQNDCSLKESMAIVSQQYGVGKNELYPASLKLKEMLK